ncbi:acyl-CoA carboxylase epsilon subunit [Nocardia alba]|uniref:Acyl-CoA carboxylase epsilon subunit-like protein n=1 Tax=Nocardia alba TaxID=225051 RepID=A0A4R1FAR2_9NOCA|nr:acyl-CoA carboxylase epsilon subunit [Nocardia alba]TCJ89882.1 acyl-CoA carboxylase epsilon subunit-like protein [Nocardia alba]
MSIEVNGNRVAHDAPLLRIEHGNPDDIEIAALLAVLLATATTPKSSPAPAPAVWLRPRRHSVYVTATSWRSAA